MRIDVLNINVSASELARVFSRTRSTIDYWTKSKGLPVNESGSYNVKKSILWLEAYLRNKRPAVRIDALEQEHLANLFCVTRQTIASWTRAGLPRRADKAYDLRVVCKWLVSSHSRIAEKKYQKRLSNIRKKLRRNIAQCERFFDKEILL